MAHDYEPAELKAIRLEREKRRDEYLQANQEELIEASWLLRCEMDFGDAQKIRDNLAILAQHHTDLENAMDGNG